MEELTLHLPDVQATTALGACLGKLLHDCGQDVPPVMLHGELGSGKTTLARGIVSSLPGSNLAEVCSPSFTILNVYPTKPQTIHADLYRCSPGDGVPEDLEEALDPSSPRRPLVLLEWPENLPQRMLPAKRLDILLEECHASRRFTTAAHGKAARTVCAGLAAWVAHVHPVWLEVPAGACAS